jgi:phage gp36-like protein
MAFIVKADFYSIIRQLRLEQMTDSTDPIIEQAISESVAMVKSYLFAIYDTEGVFAKTGTERDILMMLFCKNIAVYLLHKRLPNVMMPENVKDDYTETKRQLEQVAKGIIDLDLPRKSELDPNGDGVLEENTKFRWGVRPIRTH